MVGFEAVVASLLGQEAHQWGAKLQAAKCTCRDRTHHLPLPVFVREEVQGAEEERREEHPSMVDLGAAVVVAAVRHEELLEEAEECHAV